ncbi:MAG: hypothetical protein MJE68_15025 [Proteobacteria bacterium]|nr:hypothetical protein [Pseudomonadota bacterium]
MPMTEPGEISSSEDEPSSKDEADVQAAVQKSRVKFHSEMVDKKIAGKNTSEKQSKGGGETICDSDETISKEQNVNSQNNNDQGNVQPQVLKSSSDTTLYTPSNAL